VLGILMTNPISPLPFARRLDDARDAGLLLMRLGAAAMIWTFHMRPKLAHFDEELVAFPDPMGIGHAASFALALLSEGACSIVVAIGLLARFASLPIVFTMTMVLLLATRASKARTCSRRFSTRCPTPSSSSPGPDGGRSIIDSHPGTRHAGVGSLRSRPVGGTRCVLAALPSERAFLRGP